MKKDISKKKLEEYNDVYADIFNALLFGGARSVEEDYLVPLPTESYIRNPDGSLRQGSRDIRKADRRSGRYRLICGEENQENRENTMPQRIMGYDYAAYEEQIKSLMDRNKAAGKPAITNRIHDDQRLAPVITAVLYWGEEEWSRPLRLYDMLEFPPDIEEQIRPYVADYPLNLIQMARLPLEARERLTSDFRLLAEYAALKNNPEGLKQYMENQKQVIRHPEEFLDVLSTVSGDRRYRSIQKQIVERAEKEDVTMCVLIDEWENKGIQIGLEKGIRAGAQSKAKTIARNMFLRNMTPEDTAAICEESLEQVLSWFAEWRR